MKRVCLGLIPSSLCLVGSLFIPFKTLAQVTSDGTLSTTVTSPDGSNFSIEGGNRPNGGGNLFHSFQDFSVPTNGSAVFNNANDVANIISRVTGGNSSDIFGLIKANGRANLFLINPAGIIFGPNARLDIGGSFFGSTADSLLFPEGEFSAVDTQALPLLTVNIPIGLRFRDNPGNIVNRSVSLQVPVGKTLAFIGGNVRVENGGIIFAPGGRVELGSLIGTGTIGIAEDSSLIFPDGVVRGDVSVDSSFVVVFSGGGGGSIKVNANNFNLTNGSGFISGIRNGLGSVNAQAGNIIVNTTESILIDGQGTGILVNVPETAEGNAGNIELNTGSLTVNDGAILDASNLSLGKGGNVIINTVNDVSFSNNSTIQVTGAEGGSINISAKNLNLLSDSSFFAGISIDSGFTDAESGDVAINLTEDLVVDGLDGERVSVIGNSNFGTGNAGSIDIKARNITFKNGGNVSSFNDGEGNIGNINLTATGNIIFDGAKSSQRSGISNFVTPEATGDIGEIMITAQNVSLTNGAEIESIAAGAGDGGIININSINSVSIDRSSISSEAFSTGNSGNINIVTKNFSISNGGQMSVSSLGQGNAGNISIATNNTFIATNESFIVSNIGSGQNVSAEGKVGNIFIEAKEISFADGAQIQAGFFSGAGGESGLVSVKAEDSISFTGENTGIFTNTEVGAIGNGSDIELSAPLIFLLDSSGFAANNSGKGNGGNIEINAVNFHLDFSTLITNNSGQGDSGDIDIIADSLSVNNQTLIGAVNFGQGSAGDILITSRYLSLENGSSLNTSSFGIGDAGNITLDIQETVNISGFAFNDDGTNIFPSSVSSRLGTGAEGKAGDINITARSLSLENRGIIRNATSGIGDAGNITLNIDDAIDLFGSSFITSSVERGGIGNGGNLDLQAKSLTLREGSQIGSLVLRAGVNTPGGKGIGGDLRITATDFIDISGVNTVQLNIPDSSNDLSNTTGLIPTAGFSSGLLAATQRGASGDGGSIAITTDVFRIADGAVIDNSTTNDSNAGDITINANSFEATGGGQIITATRGNGNAADIKLNITDSVFITGSDPTFAVRLARANEFGFIQGGDNIVTNQGAASGVFANTSADSTGRGGNISIGIFKGENLILDTNQFTKAITLTNGARIAADSQGEGSGGIISIQAQDFTLDNQAEILAETTAKQDNDNALSEINLGVANILQLRDDSQISTQALSNADGGNINIDTKFIIAFPGNKEGSDILTRAATTGAGGNINITAEALFGIEERKATTGNGTNDIDASSQLGLSGQINITRPEVNPTSGLLDLTQAVVDPSKLIAQNVCTQTANSEFIDIGKGGLPQNPEDMLAENSLEVELIEPIMVSSEEIKLDREIAEVKPNITRQPPAQGWVFHENGIVELVAYNPNQVGEQRTGKSHKSCQ